MTRNELYQTMDILERVNVAIARIKLLDEVCSNTWGHIKCVFDHKTSNTLHDWRYELREQIYYNELYPKELIKEIRQWLSTRKL